MWACVSCVCSFIHSFIHCLQLCGVCILWIPVSSASWCCDRWEMFHDRWARWGLALQCFCHVHYSVCLVTTIPYSEQRTQARLGTHTSLDGGGNGDNDPLPIIGYSIPWLCEWFILTVWFLMCWALFRTIIASIFSCSIGRWTANSILVLSLMGNHMITWRDKQAHKKWLPTIQAIAISTGFCLNQMMLSSVSFAWR